MIDWIRRLFKPAEHPLVYLAKAQAKAHLDAGLKGFPGCKNCQCYPEGRNDCPDHMKCRAWLEQLERDRKSFQR
jgi:hypothetical protein